MTSPNWIGKLPVTNRQAQEADRVTLTANHIHQGDCVRALEQIKAGSVDLVFADPPFNIGYDYDVYDDDRSQEDYLKWSAEWIQAVSKALKPTGSFWLAIGDEYAAELKLIAQDKANLFSRSWVIWYYTFGVNCVQGFSRSHTHLLHFVKDPKNFTFNAANPAVRVLSARQLVYADARANGNGRLPDNTWILRPQDTKAPAFDQMHDTWYFSRVAGTFKEREGFHGCQMPEQLLGRIMRVSSNPGDLVLDPFAGSGTTLAVAKKLGRQWMGIELSSEYVKRVKKRVAACHVGDPLEGPEDARTSAPRTSRGKSKLQLHNGRPLPKLDEDTQKGLIEAYQTTSQGHTTDFLLCEPDFNADFVDACKKRSLAGDAYSWNRLLLRIRKSGQLPRATQSQQRLTFADMDAYSVAAEIAMHLVTVDFDRTLDDILCSPNLAREFDRLAADFAPGFTPFHYRWAAITIRKRAKSSKELAKSQFIDWLTKRLPTARPLETCVTPKYDHPGVYILQGDGCPLYVGETLNVKTRIEQILDTKAWSDLAPGSVRVFTDTEPQAQHGLQSILIAKTDPLLNSHLLRPDLMPINRKRRPFHSLQSSG